MLVASVRGEPDKTDINVICPGREWSPGRPYSGRTRRHYATAPARNVERCFILSRCGLVLLNFVYYFSICAVSSTSIFLYFIFRSFFTLFS